MRIIASMVFILIFISTPQLVLADSGSDIDGDGILNEEDSCPDGIKNWVSNNITDHDSDGCHPIEDNDEDNDSVYDQDDNCMKGELNWVSNSELDIDSDGCKDITEDDDDDGDGVLDEDDYCPQGKTNWLSSQSVVIPYNTDNDGDGCRDADEDFDDDNDGIRDSDDDMPNDPNESLDTDSDGIGNNADDDDDGYLDIHEESLCTISSDSLNSESTPYDLDNDMICDSLDNDIDGDGYNNNQDIFPRDFFEWADSDSDGLGDNVDDDDDGDGYSDKTEADCDSNQYSSLSIPSDLDEDGLCDLIDEDMDGDGFSDTDAFPADASEWYDYDSDGIGDNSDNDIDGDGFSNFIEEITMTNPIDSDSYITKEKILSLIISISLSMSIILFFAISYRERTVVKEKSLKIIEDLRFQKVKVKSVFRKNIGNLKSRYIKNRLERLRDSPSRDLIGIKKDNREWLIFNDAIWIRKIEILSRTNDWKKEIFTPIPDRRMIGTIDKNGGEYLLRFGVLWIRSRNGVWSPCRFIFQP